MESTPWEDRLREQGFRITPQRQLVLESVNQLGHGTPEEILSSVQKTASGVNLSTIYRTLEVLESVGLITHTHIGHGAPVYHSQDESPHIHLVCDDCAEVTSIPAAAAAEFLTAKVKYPNAFTVALTLGTSRLICAANALTSALS